MSIFKKIFGDLKNNTIPNANTDNNGIGIISTNNKSTGVTEIEFKVPSNKLYYIKIETDGFTKDKIIKFKAVASYISDKLISWGDGSGFIQLCIGFRNINGQDKIVFSTYQKTLKFKKGDKIAFLFKDQEIREFELLEKGYRIDQDSDGVIIESFANITQDDLTKFLTVNTDKWRFYASDNGQPVTGTLGLEIQNDILEMTRVYKYIFENALE